LHMAQLMPLPLTVSCFSKIQIGFTFLVPAQPGSPGQRAAKRECLCVTRWKAKPDCGCGPLGYPSLHDNKLLLTGQLIRSPASIESGNLSAFACACAAVAFLVRRPSECHANPTVWFGPGFRPRKLVATRNVRRILVRGFNAPLPPEAKKILKI